MYTINQILDRYVEEKLPLRRKSTQTNYAYHIVQLRKHFGEKLANDLTADDLSAFLDVDTGKSHRTRSLAVLSAALQSAVKWRWITYNIAKEVKRDKWKARERSVTDKEVAGLKQMAPVRMALAIDLAWLTGMRQGTILDLRWDQVHMDDRVILTRHTVTNKKIEVPITKEVQAVLEKCKQLKNKKRSDLVLPNRSGNKYTGAGFRQNLQKLTEKWDRAGHDSFTFNDITMTALRQQKKLAQPLAEQDQAMAGFLEFDAVMRTEATRMSQYYKVFYCLEKSIRKMIAQAMEVTYGGDWWNSKVDPSVKTEAERIKTKEIDSGLPERSDLMLDYTTFGQLRILISQNWADVFSKKLKTEKMVSDVMTTLNRIRGPIAHFSPMSDYDVERLKFALRTWFNLLLPEGQ